MGRLCAVAIVRLLLLIRMELSHLRCVLAVAQHLNLTKAAAQLRSSGGRNGRKIAPPQLKQLLIRSLQAASSPMLITNQTGKIEYANPGASILTGYSHAELLGQTPRLFRSGTMPQQTFRGLWANLRTGLDWHGLFHNRRKNGELYWEFCSIYPLKDQRGRATHFLAVKTDLTRRAAEMARSQHWSNDTHQPGEKILRMCAWCKKNLDTGAPWTVEVFVSAYLRMQISHGICHDCAVDYFSQFSPDHAGACDLSKLPDIPVPLHLPTHWGVKE